MRVIGIDPGYHRLGVAVLEKNGRTETLLWSDCLTTSNKLVLNLRLLKLGQEFEKIVKKWQPDGLVIERLYFSSNQKTAMAVAETRGMIQYLSAQAGLAVKELTPQEIKMAITGYGRADKKQVMEMVKRLIKIKTKPTHDDEWDAIAIALTGLAVIHTK